MPRDRPSWPGSALRGTLLLMRHPTRPPQRAALTRAARTVRRRPVANRNPRPQTSDEVAARETIVGARPPTDLTRQPTPPPRRDAERAEQTGKRRATSPAQQA